MSNYYDTVDGEHVLLAFVISLVLIVSLCVCCTGKGLITIGIFKVAFSFVLLGAGYGHSASVPLSFVAGIFWIGAGQNKIKREEEARLLAAMEVHGGAGSPSADVNISVVQNAEESTRKQVHVPRNQQRTRGENPRDTSVATEAHFADDDPQTNPSNDAIYARTVPSVEMTDITFSGGDANRVTPGSNLQIV